MQDNGASDGSTPPIGLVVLAILLGCAVMIGLGVAIDKWWGSAHG
jgi:hypothetical protein